MKTRAARLVWIQVLSIAFAFIMAANNCTPAKGMERSKATFQALGDAMPLTMTLSSNAGDPVITSFTVQAGFSVPPLGFTTSSLTAVNARIANLRVSGMPPIAAGSTHCLAVRGDSTVEAWGNNEMRQCRVPAGLRAVTAVAAGGWHSLALRQDGTVVAWGSNTSGQCNVPAGLKNVVAIAGGNAHSLALRADGTVVAWGSNAQYQCAVPNNLTGVVAISATGDRSLALRGDGTVASWGNTMDWYTPNGLVAIAADTSWQSMGLKADGTVTVWGYASTYPPPAGLKNVVAIAAANSHSLALRADGSVVAWVGWGGSPELATVPAGLSGVVAIAAGSDFNLALSSNGTVVAWGRRTNGNVYSQLDVPAGLVARMPVISNCTFDLVPLAPGPVSVQVPGSKVSSVAGLPNQASNILRRNMVQPCAVQVQITPGGAVTSGAKWRRVGTTAWRDSSATESGLLPGNCAIEFKDLSQVGWRPPANITTVLQSGVTTKLTALYAAQPLTVTLTGAVNDPTTSGLTVTADFNRPVSGLTSAMMATTNAVTANLSPDPQSLAAGSVPAAYTRYFFTLTPTAPGWGYVRLPAGKVSGPGGITNEVSNLLQYDFLTPATLSVNLAPGAAVTAGARWRQIGTAAWRASGASEKYYFPDKAAIEFRDIRLSGWNRPTSTTIALSSGGVKSSSANYTALPVTATLSSPAVRSTMTSLTLAATFSVPVSNFTASKLALTNAGVSNLRGLTIQSSIACGGQHSLAVRSDGTLASWGNSAVLTKGYPAGLDSVIAVAAGGQHCLALCADGTVAAWGLNSWGQCSVPAGLRNVVAIAAYMDYSLALRDDGTVVAWGNGGSCFVPKGLGNVVAIAAGGSNCLALLGDGTVASWNYRSYNSDYQVLPDLSQVVAIAAGETHCLALRADGTVAAWGTNSGYGQCDVPAGLSGVVAIAAGRYHNLALRADGTVAAWGGNISGATSVPAGLKNVTAIAAGGDGSRALRADGTIAAWGDSQYGQLTVPAGLVARQPLATRYSFVLMPLATGSVRIQASAGAGFTCGGISSQASNVLQWSLSLPSALQVTLDPSGATAAGAQWRRVGTTAWRNSGSSETGIVTGKYTIEMKDISLLGWMSPSAMSATLPSGATTKLSAHYTALPLTATLTSTAPDPAAGPIPVVAAVSRPVSGLAAAGLAVTNGAVTRLRGITALPVIAAGYNHGLVLRSDGTIADLGSFSGIAASPSGVPAGLTDVVAVTAGVYHSLALRADGTVVAWGNNAWNEGDVPAGLSRVVAIAAGASHSMALRDDGTVVVWGDDSSGQRRVPAGLSGVVAIAAGYRHNLALRADGTVAAWGENADGQCVVPDGLKDVVAIAASRFQSLALRADGTVVAWGNSSLGVSNVPVGLTDVVAIAASYYHSFALRADGSVVAWGKNNGEDYVLPTGVTGVVAIAGGENFALAVRADGKVVYWTESSLDYSTYLSSLAARTPAFTRFAFDLMPLAPGRVAVQLSAGGVSTLGGVPNQASNVLARNAVAPGALQVTIEPSEAVASGAQWRRVGEPDWHASGASESGLIPKSYALEFSAIPLSGFQPTVGLSATVVGASTTTLTARYDARITATLSSLARDPVTTSFTVMADFSGPVRGLTPAQLTLSNAQAVNLYPLSTYASLTAGSYQTLALRGDGTVAAWGNNASGQCDVPPGLNGVMALAAGSDHNLALRVDGTVVAWGYNNSGSCVVPPGLTGVTAIAAGGGHSLALKTDSTVAAWGFNGYYACDVPAGLTGVVAIAAGRDHSLALRADGTVVSWGLDAVAGGPVPAGLREVVAIDGGYQYSLALKADGTVVAWGNNYAGQCSVPATLKQVVAIAAGDSHALALRADGTVVAWGNNTFGQCNVPASLSQVVAIAAGSAHSLALRRDGSLVAWGDNGYGQRTVPPGSTFRQPVYSRFRFDLIPLALGAVTAQLPAAAATSLGGTPSEASNILQRVMSQSGSLKVTIQPPEAVTAGAQWRVVGTANWLVSGTTVPFLPVGSCPIEFKPVANWIEPTSRSLTIQTAQTATTSVTYLHQTGSLLVTITPPEAVAAGAKWRLVGETAWHESGSTQPGVPTGSCQIEYLGIADWSKPSYSYVTVNKGQVATISSTYTRQTGTVLMALTPSQAVTAGAKWRYAGSTTWYETGVCTSLPTGNYTLEFMDLPDWESPGPMQVTVASNQSIRLGASYTPHLALTLDPPSVMTAKPGEAVTLQVAASGTPELIYQWKKDGVAIAGATGATFTLAACQLADAGLYSCTVRNSFLAVESGTARLVVSNAGPVLRYLLGLSTNPAGLDLNGDGKVNAADVIKGLQSSGNHAAKPY